MSPKIIVARNPEELASIFGLSPADAAEWEARRQINNKIIEAIKESGMTHAQVAKASGTSRSRVTAIVNRNRNQVSTDLLLRILGALGYRESQLLTYPTRRLTTSHERPSMPDFLSLPVKDFLAATAAKAPTPGGGSVAALCGALAASLAAMALEYTAGKKAFAAHDAEIRAALAQFQNASAMLQELIAEDVAAYEAVSALLKLPEPERQAHADYLPAVVAAIRAPRATAGFAMNILERCSGLLDKTNKMLVSDLGIAGVYAHATVHASEINVRVNLPLLPNQEEAAAVRSAMRALADRADAVYARFHADLMGKV